MNRNSRTISTGTAGRFEPERVDAFLRNGWTISSEYAFFVGRMARETPDERMAENYQRAGLSMLKFCSLLRASLFAFVILNSNVFHVQYVPMKVVELVVAFVFASSLIFQSFLIYYYDQVE